MKTGNRLYMPYSKRQFGIGLLWVVMACSGTLFGQGKKWLSPNDYSLWSTLSASGVSPDGKWAAYRVRYANGADTLCLARVNGAIKYRLATAQRELFSGSYFMWLESNGSLHILGLKALEEETLKEILQYECSPDGKYLVALSNGNGGRLLIRDLSTGKSLWMNGVTAYAWHQASGRMAYIRSQDGTTRLEVRQLGAGRLPSLAASCPGVVYSDITWQKNGASLAFLERHSTDHLGSGFTAVVHYQVDTGSTSRFTSDESGVPAGRDFIASSFAYLSIADDGKRVCFGLHKKDRDTTKTNVQVWNTSDKLLAPSRSLGNGWENLDKTGIWWPTTGHFEMVTDNRLPHLFFNGTQTHAITYNPVSREPQSRREAPVDYYITDLTSGQKALMLEALDGATALVPSPAGGYFTYFWEGNWWSYHIASKRHTNLTKALPVSFAEEGYDWPEPPPAFGSPGWTEEDKGMFLYDRYDLWLIRPDGTGAQRLTNGRATGTSYRIVPDKGHEGAGNYMGGALPPVYKTTEDLLLSVTGKDFEGYSTLARGKKLITRVVTTNHCSSPAYIPGSGTLLYIEEHFDSPPALLLSNRTVSRPKVLYRSNPQHDDFLWGHSGRVRYSTTKGMLSGALYYPAGYDPLKSYPLVVHIYQKQSMHYNHYVNPSEYSPAGFNISLLTAIGYMVLLPDIAYTIGDPGGSALECVTAAVDAAAARANIDRTKMALIGHSFGGYETLYIITHSTLFAAAVAGSAVANLPEDYCYASPYTDITNYWRYEFGQMRMGKGLFEDPGSYWRNSPLQAAPRIETPLLSWTGNKDYQVLYYQSLEFHLALRRLGKANTLLLYEDEGHVLSRPSSLQHLTRSIGEWLDYYLQGGKKPSWTE